MTRLRLPACTVLLCTLAVLAQTWPWLADAAIYDRMAIDQGQWWRLATGNLVHLSVRHLVTDVLALLVIGGLAEQRLRSTIAVPYLLATLVVGATVYLGMPGLRWFGGLSGVVNAALVLLALDGAGQDAPTRRIWWLVLGAVAIKLTVECTLGLTVMTAVGGESFAPVPLSHVAGAMTGVLFHWLQRPLFRSPDRSCLAKGPGFAGGGNPTPARTT